MKYALSAKSPFRSLRRLPITNVIVQRQKRCLSNVLAKVKETWIVKKRRRIVTHEVDGVLPPLMVDPLHRAAEEILVIEDAPTIAVRMISRFIYHLTQ